MKDRGYFLHQTMVNGLMEHDLAPCHFSACTKNITLPESVLTRTGSMKSTRESSNFGQGKASSPAEQQTPSWIFGASKDTCGKIEGFWIEQPQEAASPARPRMGDPLHLARDLQRITRVTCASGLAS